MLAQRLGALARRHVVLFASTLDHQLAEEAGTTVVDAESHYLRGTATALLERRRHAIALLARRGVHAIDAAPSQLTPSVVEGFRRMRRQGLV